MIDLLITNAWLAATLWGLLYVCDHVLTRVAAKSDQALPQEHHVVSYQGGIELNPVVEQEVKQLQWFSRRFMVMFSIVFLLIVFLGFIAGKILFEILIGAFILEWVYLNLNHFQNLLSLQDLKNPRSAAGQIEVSYWFSQRTAAYSLLSFAILYLVIAIFTYRLFFVGGAMSCTILALRQFSLADRKFPSSASTTSDTAQNAKSQH